MFVAAKKFGEHPKPKTSAKKSWKMGWLFKKRNTKGWEFFNANWRIKPCGFGCVRMLELDLSPCWELTITNISPLLNDTFESMLFLFPSWDMLYLP